MSGQEVLALLYLEKRLFPREKSLAVSPDELTAMADAQAQLLHDVPFEVGRAALAAHAASSPYAPAISEIRAFAQRISEPEPLTADEAWSLAIKAVRRYGCGGKNLTRGKYPHELAKESLPGEVWRVMELMGYQSMCRSENADVLRGQFIAAWERQQKRKSERENILPFLPEGLKTAFLALGDGEKRGEEGEKSEQCIFSAREETVP